MTIFKSCFLLSLVVIVSLQQQKKIMSFHEQKQRVPQGQKKGPQTIHQADAGKWKSIPESKEAFFSQYLICGAEMNNYRLASPYNCQIIAKPFTSPISITCIGGKPIWQRANGIKFKYCNFQDWDDQKSSLFYGSWQWLGMKMCPRNQYVYSYSTRVSQADGLNGLILLCKDKYTNEESRVTVKQGKGAIKAPQANNGKFWFAYDYNIKFKQQADFSYITGLNLVYTPFPQIVNMSVSYEPTPFHQIKIEYQVREWIHYKQMKDGKESADMVTVYDINKVVNEMLSKKTNLTKQKPFNYLLSNSKNKYHGQLIRKYLSETYKSPSLLLPRIISKKQEQNEIDRSVKFKMHPLQSNFEFGRQFNNKIPQYEPQRYTIPKCNSLFLKTTIYSSNIYNPYTLTVTYQSGKQTMVEKIKGYFRGQIFGRPEIEADYYYVC